MTSLATQVKAPLLSHGKLSQNEPSQGEQAWSRSLLKRLESISLSLKCAMQTLPSGGGLCARLSYYFPTPVVISLDHIFTDAEALNQRLVSSQVFVVQDLDGDHGYYLRMDTVQTGRVDAESISKLLDSVAQDVSILLAYYRVMHQIVQV
ncbi:MAG: hypothetical protein AAGN15_19135 [Cyanobacteria bacterium J06581_3]